MTAFAFIWPAALAGLLLVPILALLLRFLEQRQDRAREGVIGPRHRLLIHRRRGAPRVARGYRRGAALLACALLVIAAAQPSWGADSRRIDREQADVMICLDVSRSMLARDVPPSRLRSARRAIETLSARAGGDRLGLVAFAGSAELLVPLTEDLGTFRQLLENAEAISVGRGGTDLGAALTRAAEAMPEEEGRRVGTIVVVTDGEDHAGTGADAAAECRDLGLVVHCVGIGTTAGSKIAISSEDGQRFLRSSQGDEVVTAMDPVSLDTLARAGGGRFVDGSGRPDALVDLYVRDILPRAQGRAEQRAGRQLENRFQLPLVLALLLLFGLIGEGRKSR